MITLKEHLRTDDLTEVNEGFIDIMGHDDGYNITIKIKQDINKQSQVDEIYKTCKKYECQLVVVEKGPVVIDLDKDLDFHGLTLSGNHYFTIKGTNTLSNLDLDNVFHVEIADNFAVKNCSIKTSHLEITNETSVLPAFNKVIADVTIVYAPTEESISQNVKRCYLGQLSVQ